MYPTKEEVLAAPYTHPVTVVEYVRMWKKEHPAPRKEEDLEELLRGLAYLHNKHFRAVKFNAAIACYSFHSKVIYLKNLSIITALHEFGHHLKGGSEFEACRWSIWLFKSAFPEAFKKLEWKENPKQGLLLVNPKK